jgi:hypothetical protein
MLRHMFKKNNLAASLAALLLAFAPAASASSLGSAGDFTLLGGTAITASGPAGTVIKNGNVGVSPAAPGSITGFPPAIIQNGAIILDSSVTAQARQDLIIAQAGIAAMQPDANISNVDLGTQPPLPPGVYKFNANANLTGTVLLDGQGKNGVFWVFQIGTDLTTAANAAVTIINAGSNGGSDYGIFWNCGTAVTVGADNQIAGIYLAGTSIVFGANSTRGGRALALAGITLNNNQIDAKGGAGGTDYSGGLMFDEFGRVVPLDAAVDFSFRYFGKQKRMTHSYAKTIKGDATERALNVQWATRGQKWHSVSIHKNGRWLVKVRGLHPGKNKVRLRATNASGDATAIKRLMITRR